MRLAIAMLAVVTFPNAVPAAPSEDVIPEAHYVDTAECNAAIEDINKGIQATMDRLDATRGGSAERKCLAFRNHIDISKEALRVYERCALGSERATTTAILTSSIDAFTGLFDGQCADSFRHATTDTDTMENKAPRDGISVEEEGKLGLGRR